MQVHFCVLFFLKWDTVHFLNYVSNVFSQLPQSLNSCGDRYLDADMYVYIFILHTE